MSFWSLYKWFHNTGFNPAVSETLLTYPSSRQKNFPSRIGHIYWLLHFADVKYRQETVATRVPLRRFRRFLRKKWFAAAQVNWKTNRGESRGISGRDFRCRWLTPCLRNRWVVPLIHFRMIIYMIETQYISYHTAFISNNRYIHTFESNESMK